MRIIRAYDKKKHAKMFDTIKPVPPPLSACVAHRCDRHEQVKPMNLNTTEGVECGACVAENINNLMVLYGDMRDRLDRACNALDLMTPGAGDPFRAPIVTEPEGATES